MIVAFTPNESTILKEAARVITERCIGIENRSQMDQSKTQAELDEIGLLGEYALAKVLGLPLEACGMMLKGIKMDDGYDIRLNNGKTVQVKAVQQKVSNTSHPFKFALDCDNANNFKADYGVLSLVQPDKWSVKLAGYVDRKDFIERHEILDLGSGPRAGMYSYNLRLISQFLQTETRLAA